MKVLVRFRHLLKSLGETRSGSVYVKQNSIKGGYLAFQSSQGIVGNACVRGGGGVDIRGADKLQPWEADFTIMKCAAISVWHLGD